MTLEIKNERLLNDELYLGLRKPRVRGERYDEFVDTFVQTARRRFPNAYIHLCVHPSSSHPPCPPSPAF